MAKPFTISTSAFAEILNLELYPASAYPSNALFIGLSLINFESSSRTMSKLGPHNKARDQEWAIGLPRSATYVHKYAVQELYFVLCEEGEATKWVPSTVQDAYVQDPRTLLG